MKIDADAWYDPKVDMVYVRVRYFKQGKDGEIWKYGCKIEINEEELCAVVEGMEYPRVHLNECITEPLPIEKVESNSMDRFEHINKDLND